MIGILGATLVLFIGGFAAKKIFPGLCVLCFAVAGTWILLLLTMLRGGTISTAALAAYMGASAAGFMYFAAARIPEKYLVFKFPYLVSALAAIVVVAERKIDPASLGMLSAVWVAFGLVFLMRHRELKGVMKRLIECCKNW